MKNIQLHLVIFVVNRVIVESGLVDMSTATDLVGLDTFIKRVVHWLKRSAADQRDPGASVSKPVVIGW